MKSHWFSFGRATDKHYSLGTMSIASHATITEYFRLALQVGLLLPNQAAIVLLKM